MKPSLAAAWALIGSLVLVSGCVGTAECPAGYHKDVSGRACLRGSPTPPAAEGGEQSGEGGAGGAGGAGGVLECPRDMELTEACACPCSTAACRSSFRPVVSQTGEEVLVCQCTELLGITCGARGARVAVGVVGPPGGTITLPGSVGGGEITFPPGAAPESTVVFAASSQNPPIALPPGTGQQSGGLDLSANTTNDFTQPITVTIPFNNAGMQPGDVPGVFYFDRDYGRYSAVSVRNVDLARGRVSFRTSHFSTFIVISARGIGDGRGLSADSGFRPNRDGFFQPNFGSFSAPGGVGISMASFASWYYANHAAVDPMAPRLFDRFREGDPARQQDDFLARELISRVYFAMQAIWGTSWPLPEYSSDAATTGALAINALIVTGAPQTMVFRGTRLDGSGGFAHSIVLYQWDGPSGRFQAYDSSVPGIEVPLSWSPGNGFSGFGRAGAFDPIEQFGLESTSTFLRPRRLEKANEGAGMGFAGGGFARIDVNDPALDQNDVAVVDSLENVKVDITVTGGDPAPTEVLYSLNGGAAQIAQLNMGNAIIDLGTLDRGDSTLSMLTSSGLQSSSLSSGGYRSIRIKLRATDFFENFGFESGDSTGWTVETHTWQNRTPGSFAPEKSSVVGAGLDPIANTIFTTYDGDFALRVNNSDNSFHISSASQTAQVPDLQNAQLEFAWAAVLEDPRHQPADQPYVDVVVTDTTTGEQLYAKHFFANDPSYVGWIPFQGGGWQAIDWQLVTIPLVGRQMHQIEVRLEAADCALGGHGGYAYLDAQIVKPCADPGQGRYALCGRVTYDHVPATDATEGGPKLDYAAKVRRPSRRVLVRAVEGETVIDEVVTDDFGQYKVAIPDGKTVKVRAYAITKATGYVKRGIENCNGATWNVNVVDNTSMNAQYVVETMDSFSRSKAGVDVHAAIKHEGGAYTDRAGAPFAILNTIVQTIELVCSAQPAVTLSALQVNWSPNNVPASGDKAMGQIGTSHYTGSNLFILGQENVDTDELDDHVIAHEYGHYLEDNRYRSDSIGGAHSSGEFLDPRVAFGEGYGNALSGMVFADPVYVDTRAAGQGMGFTIDVSQAPAGNDRGIYSETSVQYLLWKLFDNRNATANSGIYDRIDNIMLNFQRLTNAFTTAQSFAAYYNEQYGGAAESLQTLWSTNLQTAYNSLCSGACTGMGDTADQFDTDNDVGTSYAGRIYPDAGVAKDAGFYRLYRVLAAGVNAGNSHDQTVAEINGPDFNKLGDVRWYSWVATSAQTTVTVNNLSAPRNCMNTQSLLRAYRLGAQVAASNVTGCPSVMFATQPGLRYLVTLTTGATIASYDVVVTP